MPPTIEGTVARPLRNRGGSGVAAAEDAAPAGADGAAGDDQQDAEDDLTLQELHDADDDEDGCDEPEEEMP